MKKKIIRVSALIGIVIFVYIVYKIGPLQIWENIKKITWQNFLILVFLRLFYWMLRTINWKIIFEQYEENASLFHMYIARMCSHAVSQLTPSAQVGGEAARIFLVRCSSKKISLASVIVDKTIEYLTVIFFTIIGVTIALTRIPIPGKLKTLFIGFVVGATFFLLFILSKQRKGLFKWMVNILGKMKIRFKFIERNIEKVQETDKHISNFYQKHPRVFLKVFLLYSLLILLWTAEVHLTLIFIGATDITFLDSFLITTLGNLAFIFPLVPASLGIYEVTYVALFALLGKGTDVGFTLVLIRRLIALIWAGIGLLGMLKVSPKKREKLL
jgi:uncharacterized protein (TIRG00374 family)